MILFFFGAAYIAHVSVLLRYPQCWGHVSQFALTDRLSRMLIPEKSLEYWDKIVHFTSSGHFSFAFYLSLLVPNLTWQQACFGFAADFYLLARKYSYNLWVSLGFPEIPLNFKVEALRNSRKTFLPSALGIFPRNCEQLPKSLLNLAHSPRGLLLPVFSSLSWNFHHDSEYFLHLLSESAYPYLTQWQSCFLYTGIICFPMNSPGGAKGLFLLSVPVPLPPALDSACFGQLLFRQHVLRIHEASLGTVFLKAMTGICWRPAHILQYSQSWVSSLWKFPPQYISLLGLP